MDGATALAHLVNVGLSALGDDAFGLITDFLSYLPSQAGVTLSTFS